MKLNNYKVARICMVVIISLSVLIGNYRCVHKWEKQVIQVFEVGENKDGLCARNDIKDRYNDAVNLLSLASRNTLTSTAIDSLNEITQELSLVMNSNTSSNVISQLYTLNNKMTIAFDNAYNFLLPNLNPTDTKFLRGLYDDFHSSGNILSHSYYNQVAVEYNQMIQSFPNSILSITNQAKPLPLFGE